MVLILLLAGVGCGHSQMCNVGLISFGNLEGKSIPQDIDGPILEGRCAAKPGILTYYLSDAVRDALKDSQYDTLVDVEVITKTGLFVPSNKLIVKGKALNSESLEQTGGDE